MNATGYTMMNQEQLAHFYGPVRGAFPGILIN
jgi:hypothetical protein